MDPRHRWQDPFTGMDSQERAGGDSPYGHASNSHPAGHRSTERITTVHHVPAKAGGTGPNEYLLIRIDTYSTASGAHGDRTGPYGLGEEWLTGRGPRKHVFGSGDPITELLRKHEHIRALVK